jgi:hypothetical protein
MIYPPRQVRRTESWSNMSSVRKWLRGLGVRTAERFAVSTTQEGAL